MEYRKDFDSWNHLKKEYDSKELADVPYFKEREIWQCVIGCNVGFEQDGTSKNFSRPVLILKVFSAKLFIGVPLTSKMKSLPYYYPIGLVRDIPAIALLQQMRPFSSKRLVQKMQTLSVPVYNDTRKAASECIFGS